MATKLDVPELQKWFSEGRRFALIDVLPEESFMARHLPGARRASVYEVDFLEQFKKLGVKRDEPAVVYGAGGGSLDSAVAVEKLERAGVTNLFDFAGGLEAWARAGGVFEGDGILPAANASPEDRQYAIDAVNSTVEWIGRNLNSTHRGTIRILHGEVTVRGGDLESGKIVLDMQSIENTDLPDPSLRRMLEAHLKSDDFFYVERFPTAELSIKSASPLPDSTPGSPNFLLSADLTIKDATHSIDFPAIVALDDSGAVTALAGIEIDRTRWNVLYGSGRFFRMLGKHLVNDAITLLVKMVAR